MTRVLRLLPWLLSCVAVADWLALRSGLASHPPMLLAGLVVTILLALAANLAYALRRALGGPERRLQGLAEVVLIAGVAMALVAGLLNYLYSLQGFVVLQEGSRVDLAGGSELQHFASGPWARIEDLDARMELLELELLPAGGGSFVPQSRLVVEQSGGEPELVEVGAGGEAASGVLRFHQGAFGFAPEIVVLRDGVTLFERVVPFTTVREGPAGVSFEQDFTLDEGQLKISASVDLVSLSEAMEGHATLRLSVERDGRPLGAGSLLPGYFADLAEGHRVGFIGLERWSEIDLSRRHYGRWVVAGGVVAALGFLAWLPCRWLGR